MRIKAKHSIWGISAIVFFITIGEIFARYYLGLGTPPLTVSHPTIEHLYKPNQDVYVFGNHFIVNQYGMRSEPFAIKKDNGELRILFFGDSVLNGGNLIDQTEIATSILKDKISKITNKKVIVGNISSGVWGPGNWLAYVREYGFFDADIVVLVISSHDYGDNRTFLPLNPIFFPTNQPVSALYEGIERYLPRYLPQMSDSSNVPKTGHFIVKGKEEEAAQEGLADLKRFLELAKISSASVLVFQHYEKLEIESGHTLEGHQRIKKICEQLGIIPTSLEPYFRKSIEGGVNPYRDNIHPNKVGQMLIAEAILAKIHTKLISIPLTTIAK
jgi:lysophospholipase L1-like esterase